jgi:hypothetical protein
VRMEQCLHGGLDLAATHKREGGQKQAERPNERAR